jgi:hypothetical protein
LSVAIGVDHLSARVREVVSLDLAVGLWPVGPRELRCCSEVFERVAPELGLVAGSVVGDDALGGDTELIEVGVGLSLEADSGEGLFVRMDLGVNDLPESSKTLIGSPIFAFLLWCCRFLAQF